MLFVAISRRRSTVVSMLACAVLAACVIDDDRAAAPGKGSPPPPPAERSVDAYAAHREIFDEELFPSAERCRACHPTHYREWSVSGHAYAQISPVFNAMQGALNIAINGTLGDFCIRCHTPVGMIQEEPVFAPNAVRSDVSLEGVTCVVCHRVNRDYGKVSGRFHILEGTIFEPIYGPHEGDELARVLESSEEYGALVTAPGEPGRKVHAEARPFFQMTTPAFCGRCHDVRFIDGFRVEDAFSEYKQSPAARRGESCQDCHMGIEPGYASGYDVQPAAIVGDVPTRPRKHTNHMLAGPDYSVVHPGIYPHNPDAKELASVDEWLAFDLEAGWGTDDFEDEVDDDHPFPERWTWPDDRYEARDVLDDQLALLAESRERAESMLRRGYLLGDIRVTRANAKGLHFEVEVSNGTDGHNVPTGFAAERLVYLRVTVENDAGDVVFQSGDADPNGDLRDLHSFYVHDGKVPLDPYLFSLQSPFLLRNLRGSEREQILPFNYSIDPLPFARPSVVPTILSGQAPQARLHKKSIEPLGKRTARYRVEPGALEGSAHYSISVELVAGMLPANLVGAIAFAGFDYQMSPRDVADAVVAGHRVLWQREIRVEVER